MKNVSSFLRSTRLDVSAYHKNIWLPKISYTEENDIYVIGESVILYPNGTVNYIRDLIVTITCDFNYQNIPRDTHVCRSVAYL
jgi:hypothetical protein